MKGVEFNFLACLSKGTLIQYSLHATRRGLGWGGGAAAGQGGCFLPGSRTFHAVRRDYVSKNAADETDRIINHVSGKKKHNARGRAPMSAGRVC